LDVFSVRSSSPLRRVLATGFAAALLISLAPAASVQAAPAAPSAAVPASACTVETADATWGFKESFRSYISGTIANGQWEVSGGAGYATPNFTWTGGSGWYDPETQTGEVDFTGSIHFTGHNGLLNTTVENPTLLFTGPGSARMLLDVAGVSMDDAMAGGTEVQTVTRVPFVDVDLATAAVEPADHSVTVTAAAAPTVITADGFAAFGSYETATPFDPLAFTITATCAPEETPTPTATPGPIETDAIATTDAEPSAATSSSGWVPWTIGGVVVLAAVVAGAVISRRRRSSGAAPGAGSSDSSGAP
jgi:hypothetical protein